MSFHINFYLFEKCSLITEVQAVSQKMEAKTFVGIYGKYDQVDIVSCLFSYIED